jgi:hypothetical protein
LIDPHAFVFLSACRDLDVDDRAGGGLRIRDGKSCAMIPPGLAMKKTAMKMERF